MMDNGKIINTREYHELTERGGDKFYLKHPGIDPVNDFLDESDCTVYGNPRGHSNGFVRADEISGLEKRRIIKLYKLREVNREISLDKGFTNDRRRSLLG
jgi:hypothetical protein